MKQRLGIVLVVLFLLSLACNMPAESSPTPVDANILLTQIAQTLVAGEQLQIQTPTQAAPTAIAAVTTAVPERTATFTLPAAPATATVQSCDTAAFIQDVTVPDNSKIVAGQTFTKTWRLQNVGACTWNRNYALVFSGGDAFSAPPVVNLLGDVPPNALVDISVEMKAPATPGRYISHWKLRNSTGQVFGVSGNQSFFAQIEVVSLTLTPTITVTPSPTVAQAITLTLTPTLTPTRQPSLTPPVSGVKLDLVSSMCKAEWRSDAGVLPCPGSSGDSRGYVMRLENPRLETGSNESQPVLLMVPENKVDGAITGRYASLPIAKGDHFQATLGCLADQPQCSVIYQLNYSLGGGDPVNLQQWTQVADGSIQGVVVDLSSLAGKNVDLILVVLTQGPADQALAVWINPRIVQR